MVYPDLGKTLLQMVAVARTMDLQLLRWRSHLVLRTKKWKFVQNRLQNQSMKMLSRQQST